MSEGDLPVVDPADVKPVGDQQRIGGILLAAGESSRFQGGNKLLATYDGEPLVWHAALTLVQAGLSSRVAVLGRDADEVEAAIAGLGFEFVRNPDYTAGQATSVRAGIDAVGAVNAAVIALGDMPAVSPRSVAALVDVYGAGAGTALAAAHDGQRGNPVLFDRQYFDALRDVEGDTGGRRILLEGEDAALVETGDRGVLQDVDTRADLEALRGDD
jgi:molybdenum cofactor cytidylyltransferase